MKYEIKATQGVTTRLSNRERLVADLKNRTRLVGELRLLLGASTPDQRAAAGMPRRNQLRCHAVSQGDAADALLCWDFMRRTCASETCSRLHVSVAGVPLCGRLCGELLGWRSRGACAPNCAMAHPEEVAPCLAAALAGSGFGLQPTGACWCLVADGEASGSLPVPQELRLAIDFGYDRLMSSHGLASLATQAGLCHHLVKQHGEHVTLALCGLEPGGAAAAHLDGVGGDIGAGGATWGLRRHASLAELAAAEGTLVYLSPDAEEPLLALQPGCVYVVGALVDRQVISGASLARAAGAGCPYVVRRLPLTESLPPDALLGLKSALNLTTVVRVLIEWSHCREWRTALLRGLSAEQRGAAACAALLEGAAAGADQAAEGDMRAGSAR